MKIHKVFSKRLQKDVWKVEGRIGNTRIRQSGFITKREASDFVLDLHYRVRSEGYGIPLRVPEIALGELLACRLADPIANSTYNRKRLVGFFADFVGHVGPSRLVREISAAHLREFRDNLIGRKLRNSTIEFHMAGVTATLNAARLYFPELETFRAPTLPGLVTEGRSTLVPRTELRDVVDYLRRSRAFSATRQASADLIEMLQLTGARVSEISTLKRPQIDFDRHLLTLYGSKTHTKRTLPMSESVELILRRREVFPSAEAVRQTIIAIAPKLGITFGRAGWVIHDIRHTAASVLAEAGVSHSIIAACLGHRLGGMTARYTHATLPALKVAVRLLETYWLGEAQRLRIVHAVN